MDLVFVLLVFGLVLVSQFTNGVTQFLGEVDLVTSLPDLTFQLNYRHYSGYLDSVNHTKLHYWFFESQTGHPEKDPIVLWLNGGPGCSSLLGALTELGPIRVNVGDGSLERNPFGWNQNANVLFLESPGGVGYSFQKDHYYSVNDTTTAALNYEALKSFYVKFPHYSENDFYMSGESYAGVYIPTLAMHLLEHNFPKHFKGVAIGNGLLDYDLNGNSLLHFYYHHGLLDWVDYQPLLSKCCNKSPDIRHCAIVNTKDSFCNAARAHALRYAEVPGINPYNIYDVCELTQNKNGSSVAVVEDHHDPNPPVSYDSVAKRIIYDSLNLNSMNEDYYVGGAHEPICSQHDYLRRYLNKPEVRAALHIDSHAWDWASCRAGIGYHRELKSMKQQVKRIVDAGLKVLIFNGDVDSVCNFLGDEWFADDLGYRIRIPYRPWFTPSGQTGGFAKFYEKHLIFATVLGAGHMVPTDQPEAALKLFNSFLRPAVEFQ